MIHCIVTIKDRNKKVVQFFTEHVCIVPFSRNPNISISIDISITTIACQVIEVNGINVEGQTPNHVLNILREAEHTITFKLIPNVGR